MSRSVPPTFKLEYPKFKQLKGEKTSKYYETMKTQKTVSKPVHPTIDSFQILSLLKTALQICALNARIGAIPNT